MLINYALVIAVVAPLIDFAYDLFKKRYWRSRLKAYCPDNSVIPNTSEIISKFTDRAVIIDSHFRFWGWWSMSLVGTIVTAYEIKNLLLSIVIVLVFVVPLWVYYLFLEFDEIIGWRKYIPLFYRLIGYGVSILLAVFFPKTQ